MVSNLSEKNRLIMYGDWEYSVMIASEYTVATS